MTIKFLPFPDPPPAPERLFVNKSDLAGIRTFLCPPDPERGLQGNVLAQASPTVTVPKHLAGLGGLPTNGRLAPPGDFSALVRPEPAPPPPPPPACPSGAPVWQRPYHDSCPPRGIVRGGPATGDARCDLGVTTAPSECRDNLGVGGACKGPYGGAAILTAARVAKQWGLVPHRSIAADAKRVGAEVIEYPPGAPAPTQVDHNGTSRGGGERCSVDLVADDLSSVTSHWGLSDSHGWAKGDISTVALGDGGGPVALSPEQIEMLPAQSFYAWVILPEGAHRDPEVQRDLGVAPVVYADGPTFARERYLKPMAFSLGRVICTTPDDHISQEAMLGRLRRGLDSGPRTDSRVFQPHMVIGPNGSVYIKTGGYQKEWVSLLADLVRAYPGSVFYGALFGDRLRR